MKRFLKTDVFEGRKWLAPVVALTLVFFVTCFLLFLALAALSGILFYRNGLAPHLNATLDRDVANYQEYLCVDLYSIFQNQHFAFQAPL